MSTDFRFLFERRLAGARNHAKHDLQLRVTRGNKFTKDLRDNPASALQSGRIMRTLKDPLGESNDITGNKVGCRKPLR